MNFHNVNWINDQVDRHFCEAIKHYGYDNTIVCALTGSQNYGLNTHSSDVDTKVLVVPTFEDFAYNRQPVSTTVILDNAEHVNVTDMRLYFNMVRKQSPNFLEVFFTQYYYTNTLYASEWNMLRDNAELLARLNPYRAVKSMEGMVNQRTKAFLSKMPTNPKSASKDVSHVLRIEDCLKKYVDGESFAKCLRPEDHLMPVLFALKNNEFPDRVVERLATEAQDRVATLVNKYTANQTNCENEEALALLEKIQYNMMVKAVYGEEQ